MNYPTLTLVMMLALLLATGCNGEKNQAAVTKNIEQTIAQNEKIIPTALAAHRSFFMGFVAPKTSDWGYDFSVQSVEDTYKLMESSADLVCVHLAEGVPWPEAFERKPYHPHVQAALQSMRQHTANTRAKIFLYISPVNGEEGLEGHWAKDGHLPRPGKWQAKDFDDPEAITAYLNFTRDMIAYFSPDFLAYGVEVNFLAKHPERWRKFLVMAREIYTRLKAAYPRLPVFVSWQIDEHWANLEIQQPALKQILPYTDYLAVSTYPYFYHYFNPANIPSNYFSGVAALAPQKPFAVAETGFIAEDYAALGVKGAGSAEWQNQYLAFLFAESNKLKAEFIVWYVPIDYDCFWNKIKLLKPFIPQVELYRVWRDAGLLDGAGRPRPAWATWMEWLKAGRR